VKLGYQNLTEETLCWGAEPAPGVLRYFGGPSHRFQALLPSLSVAMLNTNSGLDYVSPKDGDKLCDDLFVSD